MQDDKFQQQRQAFQQAQMDDQQQQMQRRRQIQDLALNFVRQNPDGSSAFDEGGYTQALMSVDPQAAIELHRNTLAARMQELQTQKTQRELNTPDLRRIEQGNNILTQEQQADGSYKTIATAGRFAPTSGASNQTALERNVRYLMSQGLTRDQALQAQGIPAPGAAEAPTHGAGTPNGDDFLKSLPSDRQAVVRAVVEGRYPVPTGKAATSPWWQSIVQDAQQVDPTFEAGSYQARAASRKDFTSGTTAKNITALNTAAHHLDQLLEQGKRLNNSRFPTWNKLANSVGSAVGKDAVNNYNLNADAVADELAKVFAGSGGALADREQIRSRLDASLSPQQQEGFGRTAANLIEGRLAGLQAQLDQGLGYGSKSIQLVSPESQNLFNKFRGGEPAPSGGATGKYTIGQIIEANGKRYRVTGISNPNDPDVAEVR
ncbi:hypothetical protein SAMN02800692_1852 [Luteibacter sp. UNC138MFCol5.1]|uniref:hypothetical protein n=1 Tax=Luteibacter sp. UNC138MFCol5.1 TaxID=1502774 RepID=UPI0008AD42DF|nr:hypothetical protein [Luteibacter sp. UNC138MFCol5.1]SEO74353.1 hypothetical protein SAMN02800692_1852 [Luteibacter sp. UNC138MFCol5.1]